MKTIKSIGQNKELDMKMKVEDVKEYGDFINYLIIKALANLVKYSNYGYDEILSREYSYDELRVARLFLER